jgi:hypothetical protein
LVFGTKRSGLKSPARAVSYSSRKWVTLQFLVALGHRLVTAFRQIVAAEIAPAHVDADQHIHGHTRNGIVDRLDIEIDELVGVLARGLHFGADGRIAQHGDRHLVELHVAAACPREIRDLLTVDLCEVGKEGARIRIDGRVGKIGAAIKMHGGGRRHGDLARHLRHFVQEFELVRASGGVRASLAAA